jgi:hypothetical protein
VVLSESVVEAVVDIVVGIVETGVDNPDFEKHWHWA